MKQAGCYELMGGTGALAWEDGQTRAAVLGFAPYPEVLPMHPLQHPGLCELYSVEADPHISKAEAKHAMDWFNATVNVYVLNLPKDVARWQAVSSRLEKLGIAHARVDGVDLSQQGALKKAQEDGVVPADFNFTMAQENARTEFNGMGGIRGTVGCASAHLRAMKIALHPKGRHKPLALVLEDDVVLLDDFVWKLRQLLTRDAPCDWDAISLKSKCPYGECVSRQLSRVRPDGNEPAKRCRHGVNYGFFAMLYRLASLEDLRSKLAKAVWEPSHPHCLDVDVALASISDTLAYYAVPSMQKPGFLTEGALGSTRMNMDNPTTSTATTTEVVTDENLTVTTTTSTTVTIKLKPRSK